MLGLNLLLGFNGLPKPWTKLWVGAPGVAGQGQEGLGMLSGPCPHGIPPASALSRPGSPSLMPQGCALLLSFPMCLGIRDTTAAHYYNQGGTGLQIPEQIVVFGESQVQVGIRVGGLFGLGNLPTSPWTSGILAYISSGRQGD